ncbi:hypothetical protein F4778DRAFT_265175 [Xylariomycetidae sp. FL2044]|nr:hypothetical protein F4778DRAFT_265175 [Xylariomycetidae sp. FL2044]
MAPPENGDITAPSHPTTQPSNPNKPPPTEPLAVFPHDPLPPNLITEIHKDQSPGFYGPFNAQELAARAASLIKANSDADEARTAQVMQDFLELAQRDCLAQHESEPGSEEPSAATHSCWLCIRMTRPTDEWVLPRWHTDGLMFPCTCGSGSGSGGGSPSPPPHAKYAFTLLGPSTRILATDPEVTSIMHLRTQDEKTGRSVSAWDFNDPDPRLVERLKGFPEVEVKQGQVIRFTWGRDDSPVHSEPDMSGADRVFVTVLFGTEEELRGMCGWRREGYGVWY